MSDKIDEIRERHDAASQANTALMAYAVAHADRADLLAEVERQRSLIKRLHKALYKIAGKVPFADDPWTIALKELEALPVAEMEAKP